VLSAFQFHLGKTVLPTDQILQALCLYAHAADVSKLYPLAKCIASALAIIQKHAGVLSRHVVQDLFCIPKVPAAFRAPGVTPDSGVWIVLLGKQF
jgi:hypothetical protein